MEIMPIPKDDPYAHKSNGRPIILVDKRIASQPSGKSIQPENQEDLLGLQLTAESNRMSFPDYPYIEPRRIFNFPTNRELKLPEQQFQFDCFDIKKIKSSSADMMGCFTHMQGQSRTPFDINVKIPSLQEYTPFSNLLSLSNTINHSNILTESMLAPTPKREISIREELKQSGIKSELRKKTLTQDDSIISGLWPLIGDQSPERIRKALWEDEMGVDQDNLRNETKYIYAEIVQNFAARQEQANSFFFEAPQKQLSESDLIINLCKALQGVQSQLFQLDYATMRWNVNSTLNLRVRHYFKESVWCYVETALQAATYRSQIDTALKYLSVKQTNNKFIYSEIDTVYRECLLTLESLIIECTNGDLTFMQFDLSIRRVIVQLKLLKRFLLRQNNLRPYYDFDRTFIHSEKQLFFMAYHRLLLNDYSEEQHKSLIRRLTFGGFRCILYSLNVRLHHSRKQWEQLYYQDYYFNLFFERKRETIDKMSERLNILHQEDYEVYSVCRVKRDIKLLTTYKELSKYQRNWQRLTEKKIMRIDQLERKVQRERRRHQEAVYEQKAREIAEMKLKLAQRLKHESRLKAEQQQKQRQQIQRLQAEIKKKQEQQRLNRLIEIEREKGYLLDTELDQKRRLLHEKYELLARHPEMIGTVSSISQESQELSLRRAISQTEPQQMHSATSLLRLPSQQRQIQQVQQVVQISELKPIHEPEEPPVNFDEIEQMEVEDEQDTTEVPLKTAIQVCINQVITAQLTVVNRAISSLIYVKYDVRAIFEFLRSYFLSSKGHLMNQLILTGIDTSSMFKLRQLSQAYLVDLEDNVSRLKPTFYRVTPDLNVNMTNLMGQLNIITEDLGGKVGFEFRDLPEILKPYFSYIHLVKYVQIMGFILKLRYCVRLAEIQWKSLSNFEKQFTRTRERRTREDYELFRRLSNIRYIIHSFLNRYQNYLYFNIIEEQYNKIRAYLQAQEFDALPDVTDMVMQRHLNFLDRIIVRGFIQNSQRNISQRLSELFAMVREFSSIVTMFCMDDIASYMRPDIYTKLSEIQNRVKGFSNILEHIMGDK